MERATARDKTGSQEELRERRLAMLLPVAHHVMSPADWSGRAVLVADDGCPLSGEADI